MRRYSIALLVTGVLFAFAHSASATTTSKITAEKLPRDSRFFVIHHDDMPTRRLLRIDGTATDNNEERGYLGGLIHAGTSKVDDLLASAKLKEYEALVNKLQLGDDIVTSLRSSQLENLKQFVASFNHGKELKHQISLIAPLSAKYGDDIVAKTLVDLEQKADTVPELANLVKQLRSEQLMEWLKKDKNVDEVFNLLKLKEDGYRVLRSRKIEVLEDYITLFNREKSADETLLKVLTTGVGDESQIVSILEKARTNSRSVEKANELETALLTKWRGENLSPMTVWSRLKFSDNVDNALSSGKLGMFSKYIAKYYPNNEKSVLERFTVKYGEDAVAKALVTATNTGTMNDFASKLQTQQLEGWLARQKSAGDVFNLLKIKEDGVLSMKSRKVIVLSKYVNLFNGKNPQDKTQLFSVMKNGFGGDGGLARMVTAARRVGDPEIELTAKQYQKGLFKQWFAGDIKPENVYAKFLNGKEGHLEKAIVAQYKAHYDKQMNPQVYTFNDPRRS